MIRRLLPRLILQFGMFLCSATLVWSLWSRTLAAETTNTTATFDLGYTGGSPAAANAYANDAASNALGLKAADLANPTVVASADTIDLLINTAVPTDCIVKAFAVVVNAN